MSKKEPWTVSYPNPMAAPLRDFIFRLKSLKFLGPGLIPDALVAGVLVIVIGLLCVFWIYGVIVNVQRRFWDYVTGTKDEMEGKTTVEKVPYTITIGMFFLAWIPFVIVCSPYYLIGLIGRTLSAK